MLIKISLLPNDRESLHAIVFGIITRGELDIVALRMCLFSEGEERAQVGLDSSVRGSARRLVDEAVC